MAARARNSLQASSSVLANDGMARNKKIINAVIKWRYIWTFYSYTYSYCWNSGLVMTNLTVVISSDLTHVPHLDLYQHIPEVFPRSELSRYDLSTTTPKNWKPISL